jgi:hypothetical protein
MRNIFPIITIAICLITVGARAQMETNLPKTRIENFELQPDTIIVKGFNNLGTVTTSGGIIAIRGKESSNLTSGHKEYGISVALETVPPQRLVVDDEELEPLIRSMDALSKIAYDVTPMPAFDAAFTTKSGLQIAAHSDRRNGGIEQFLRFADAPRIPLTSDEFAQLENLIKQAKDSIDTIKDKNSTP